MTEQPDNAKSHDPRSFTEFLGIEVVEARDGWAHVRMPIRKHYLQAAEAVHGGVIMTLADTCFAHAVKTLLSPGQSMTTSELKVNFIKPARGHLLLAESRIVHKGGHLVVGDTDVTDGQGNLVAKALGTYFIIEPHGGSPQ